MKNTIHIFIPLSFLLIYYNTSVAQSIPYSDKFISPPITLEDKVNKSDAVIEGKVINIPRGDYFLLDPNSKRPFTSSVIRVSKIFKGDVKDTIIELITDGGRISLTGGTEITGAWAPSEWGMLAKDEEGLFFLRINNTNIQSGKNLQSFFFLYEKSLIVYMKSLRPLVYYDAKKITDLDKGLYQPIEAITKTPVKVTGLNSYEIQAIDHPDIDTMITFPNGGCVTIPKKDLKR